MEILSSISGIKLDHSGRKLEINYKKMGKSMDMRLNNMLLNNQCVIREIKEIKKYLETNEN